MPSTPGEQQSHFAWTRAESTSSQRSGYVDQDGERLLAGCVQTLTEMTEVLVELKKRSPQSQAQVSRRGSFSRSVTCRTSKADKEEMFTVLMTRQSSSDSLGMHLVTAVPQQISFKDTVKKVLTVKDIKGSGMVKRWNANNPAKKVRCGDIIVAANTVQGDTNALLEECNSKKETLELTIMRVNPKDRMAVIVDGKDPKNHAPSYKVVKTFIKAELEQASACLSLPLVACMLLFFCIAAFGHFEMEKLHALDRSMYFDLTENANFAFAGNTPFEEGRIGFKGIEDVNSFPDFWSWLNLGLIPLYFPSMDSWSVHEARSITSVMCQSWSSSLQAAGWPETSLVDVNDTHNMHGAILSDYANGVCPEGLDSPSVPEDFFGPENAKTHTYLYYHSIVAGLRMRQEYTSGVDCPSDMFRGHVFGGECLPDEPDYAVEPELRSGLFMAEQLVNNPAGRTVFLLSQTNQTELLKQTRSLENEVWFGPYTSKVELMFTTYNPHMDAFTANFILIFVSRSGHMHKIVEPVSFWLQPYRSWHHWVFDILWLLLVAKIVLEEGWEISRKCRQLGCVAGMKKYMGFGNLVDWMNVMYACGILAMWIWHCFTLGELRVHLAQADPTTPGSFPNDGDNLQKEAYFEQVVTVIQQLVALRRFVSFYPFVLVSRFLKIFSYQPRLALMTNTLVEASTDIIHFAIVLIVVFAVYTVSGMMLFGQEITSFAGLDRSIVSVFRILLGDFDWQELTTVGRLDTTLWFVSFMLLVNLIMLNMLLAIVMDVYTAVKGGLGDDCETLWSQLHEIYLRRRRILAGEEVPLTKILFALDPTSEDSDDDENDDEDCTVSKLMDVVDGLPREQAADILKSAWRAARKQDGSSISETNKSVMETNNDINEVRRLVEQLWEEAKNMTESGEKTRQILREMKNNAGSE